MRWTPIAVCVALAACTETAPETPKSVKKEGVSVVYLDRIDTLPKPTPADPGLWGTKVEATFDDKIKLRGVTIPSQAKGGSEVKIRLVWEVLAPVNTEPMAFVHGHVPGSGMNQSMADHLFVDGKVSPDGWQPGDFLVDEFLMSVPGRLYGDELEIWTGVYEGRTRWNATSGDADKKHRVKVGTIKVSGAEVQPRTMTAKRAGKMTIDGKLDEAEWETATRVGPFVSYDGDPLKVRNPTHARILWDDAYLYLAFECSDADVHTPYKKRDDPIYEGEAVEIFIDADGDMDEYVELQAAPNGVQFDAAFKGGPRQNFDTSYNVNYEVGTKVDGTLNKEDDVDKGWVSEWKIPFAEIKDAEVPVAGTKWKINLFRLERIRRKGKVIKSEAAAWSTPLSGDFHNIARMGTLVFE
jgi:hypothetical protein